MVILAHTFNHEDFGFAAADDTDYNLDYLVAENVSEFIVQAAGATNSVRLPKFIRVTMKVEVPAELNNTASGDQVMARTFSRVFFLENGK